MFGACTNKSFVHRKPWVQKRILELGQRRYIDRVGLNLIARFGLIGATMLASVMRNDALARIERQLSRQLLLL
jgi:hypothetical protein